MTEATQRPELVPRLNRAEPADYVPIVVKSGQGVRMGWMIGLCAVHTLLGILCKESSWIGFGHALGTLAFGLFLAFAGRPSYQLGCWAAYVVGSEVLWRMSNAPLPWEYAKYAISLVFVAGIARSGRWRIPWVPLAYFLLLLPAVAGTLTEVPLGLARESISFNLSGPLAVAVCAVFFSQVELDGLRIQRLLGWLIFPVVAIATVSLFGLIT